MTEKLYYQNPYQFEFEASVISSKKADHHFETVLDKTCFYPEGGGQPADRGWLNNARVIDVQSRDSEIIHFTDEAVRDNKISGKIDGERRRDFMQQHTGQHIMSQSLLRAGNLRTVSVHLGEDYTAIEVHASNISDEILAKSEILANKTIQKNLQVKIQWVKPEEVDRFKIRRPPPDVETIRIVEIDDFDFSACGGTHLKRTGEVGLIKIIAQEKIRGHTRLHLKIGDRAFKDYDNKLKQTSQLINLLTSGEDDIVDRVAGLQQELKTFQHENAKLQSQLMEFIAEKSLKEAALIHGVRLVKHKFENTDNKNLKIFVDKITETPGFLVIAVSDSDEKVNLVLGHSLELSLNLNEFIRPLLPIIDGRGGGNPTLFQGGGKNPAAIPEFLEKADQKIEQEINK